MYLYQIARPECSGHCINYLQPPNDDDVGAYVKGALVSRPLTPPRTPVVNSIDDRDRGVQRAFQKCIGRWARAAMYDERHQVPPRV
jgi:hypothetical protein